MEICSSSQDCEAGSKSSNVWSDVIARTGCAGRADSEIEAVSNAQHALHNKVLNVRFFIVNHSSHQCRQFLAVRKLAAVFWKQ